jgi:hypothetical protein
MTDNTYLIFFTIKSKIINHKIYLSYNLYEMITQTFPKLFLFFFEMVYTMVYTMVHHKNFLNF